MNYDYEDIDSENTEILEQCIVKAEETLLEMLPPQTDFNAFKAIFTKLYDDFIEKFTDENYWKLHAAHYDYVLW
jgi:hypothetical protein